MQGRRMIMDSSSREDRPPRRSLDDYLHKPQHDYLVREFHIGQQFRAVRWYFRLAPYPVDHDTAAAIQAIIANQVLPWGAFEEFIEEWAYPVFFENAAETEIKLNQRSREEAVAAVPDLETLRGFFWGSVPENLVGPWAEPFANECEVLLSVIKEGLLCDEPSLAGKFVYMPFLPLGQSWLGRVPLLDRVWIDRTVVELSEASALLAEEGYSRLPAADPHSLAWHRFFPPNTRWKSAVPAPHGEFVGALGRARAAVRGMPARACEISGRPCLHVADYGAWAGRRVPVDPRSPGIQEDGVSWAGWNAWVDEKAENSVVEVAGYRLSKLGFKWTSATARLYEFTLLLNRPELRWTSAHRR
jgi:hypothetical protein